MSDRIVDPLCFRDVGVRFVREFGAHYESAVTSRQFHERANDVQEGSEGEYNALNHDRVEGGSADKSDKTQADIVKVAQTIPQERIPKRCKERRLIQTTINLTVTNPTCLIEIPQIQCSVKADHQSFESHTASLEHVETS